MSSNNNPFAYLSGREISRDTMLVQQFLCLDKKKKTREISPYIDYSKNQFFDELSSDETFHFIVIKRHTCCYNSPNSYASFQKLFIFHDFSRNVEK